MPNAGFINSTLERALFRETQLNDVYFKQTSVYNINFTGAFLVRANFLDADVVQSIDFTNTDLSYAQFTENQFQGKRIGTSPHNFSHALLPNRSFGSIDSNRNLLKNGDAEMQCSTGGTIEWRTIQIWRGLSVVPLNDMAMINMTLDDWGNCTFRMMNKTARVSQFIELRHYSRLIEVGKAMVSSSAFFGCNGSTNAPYVEVSVHGSDGNLVDTQLYLNRIEDTDVFMHRYSIKEYRLPKYTTQVRISFGVRPQHWNLVFVVTLAI